MASSTLHLVFVLMELPVKDVKTITTNGAILRRTFFFTFLLFLFIFFSLFRNWNLFSISEGEAHLWKAKCMLRFSYWGLSLPLAFSSFIKPIHSSFLSDGPSVVEWYSVFCETVAWFRNKPCQQRGKKQHWFVWLQYSWVSGSCQSAWALPFSP